VKGKKFFLFFYLPFFGMIILFFTFSWLNRSYIRHKVEDLVKEQLYATINLLKADMARFLGRGDSADQIFSLYAGEENIYFMALLDHQHRVLSWSSRFEGYLPLSLEDIGDEESWIIDSPVGRIFNLFVPFTIPENQTYHLYLGYSLADLEEMLVRSRRSFYLMFAAICVAGIIFMIGIYQMQSRYLLKKREVQEQIREKERFRAISAFTSGVAHEIKNPLNSIALLLQMWARKLPREYHADLEAGRHEVAKISRIIDHFSAALKPLQLRKSRFGLKDMIEEAGQALSREYSGGESKILVEADNEDMIEADRDFFKQVLLNLMRNAMESGEAPQVKVAVFRDKKSAVIRIEDSGGGISAPDRDRIFEPFFSGKKEGMGIGLYLSRKIVEAHGGNLTLENSSPSGTVFQIQIPGE
jgi:signal transduction histidine kinase